jgi:S-formylglutathione hydrolase
MINLLSKRQCFNGSMRFYSHESRATKGLMNFALFLPSKALTKPCPVVYFLSGLSCTDENFMMKAGAQRVAEILGLILVAPDTSPRNRGIPGEKSGGRPGEGASYYVNATKSPWAEYYQMYDYITYELPDLINNNFLTQKNKNAIMGHSMGGHGALVIALRNPERFQSVSALAPICNPSNSPLAQMAFRELLGDDKADWALYDSMELLQNMSPRHKILIDQGLNDEYLATSLRVSDLALLVEDKKLPINIRLHDGYDHGYYFVATFIEGHLRFHHEILQ